MITLASEDGNLVTKREDAEPSFLKDWSAIVGSDSATFILVYRYPEGDVDCPRWPLASKDRHILASALYDARETGQLAGYPQSVLLPDGEEFHIESNLK